MDLWLIWTVIGFVLVIVELMTGTFYLLALAAGVFVAAVLAYVGANAMIQSVAGSAIALGGAWYINRRFGANKQLDAGQANFLDRGQAVVLESWVDENNGLARVKYRGTTWDARVGAGAPRSAVGATLFIEAQDGSTLIVGTAPPAAR